MSKKKNKKSYFGDTKKKEDKKDHGKKYNAAEKHFIKEKEKLMKEITKVQFDGLIRDHDIKELQDINEKLEARVRELMSQLDEYKNGVNAAITNGLTPADIEAYVNATKEQTATMKVFSTIIGTTGLSGIVDTVNEFVK